MHSLRSPTQPFSCDTFVILPPYTKGGAVIFGKNSDRPGSEVQEVVYFPGKESDGAKLQCTYIEIDQVARTNAVILSKPAWMWGAEIGSNEHGLCIGNEAVYNNLQDAEKDKEEQLLGMDLVRLGLERCSTAKEAVDTITSLLEQHGQGGPCCEDPGKVDVIYHNSFIIADAQCAWVLETAGREWAAMQVKSGYYNISNQLSITTEIDAMSTNLKEIAKEKGLWDGSSEFNFAKVFQAEMDDNFTAPKRYTNGKALLENLSKEKDFSVASMMSILRDLDSGICCVGKAHGHSVSTGSQVSLLYPTDNKTTCCHWFTATPNPACSIFKPFIFVPNVVGSRFTQSPQFGDQDPARAPTRFQSQVNREHPLYTAHKMAINPIPGDSCNDIVLQQLLSIEKASIADLEEFAANYDPNVESELIDLFNDSVEIEMKFYKNY